MCKKAISSAWILQNPLARFQQKSGDFDDLWLQDLAGKQVRERENPVFWQGSNTSDIQ
jgi:hypothetical protein